MIEIGRKEFGISGFAVRILGVICMVLGGIGNLKGVGFDGLEALGWTSFCFFAFLLSEGVSYSSSKIRYFVRLLLFGAVSEVLYDYFRFRKYLVWKYSGVMATIILGFILIAILAYIKKRFQNLVLDIISISVLGYIAYTVSGRYNFAFGGYGIILILMFYVSREITYTKITQLIVLFYICFYMSSDVLTHITLGKLQYPIAPQFLCFASLPFIWLYDDNRGPNSIALQILQYLAYPLVLCALIFFKYFRY